MSSGSEKGAQRARIGMLGVTLRVLRAIFEVLRVKSGALRAIL